MGLRLHHLDPIPRERMLEELSHDESRSAVYFSERFTSLGIAEWPRLIRDAITGGDDVTLARSLRARGLLVTHEIRLTEKRPLRVKAPHTAAETYAESEFNSYYIRALCLRATAAGVVELLVYRAKQVRVPRPDSEARIGGRVNAAALLVDLRAHRSFEPGELGIPGGPNSGLSVHLPPDSVAAVAEFEATSRTRGTR